MTRSVKYDDNSPVFLFTNENIQEYIIKSGGVKNKNMLTVASSGDHAFESLLAGAKHVDIFDVNIMQKSVVDLKVNMIRHLDYGEFMDFFFSKHSRFKFSLLNKIAKNIGPNEIILLLDLKNGNCRNFASTYSIENITYLQGADKYKDLRDRLPQRFDFKHIDVKQLPYVISNKYDVVMLSNIFEYLFLEISDTKKAMYCYYHSVLNPLSKNLNNGGTIFVDYLWGLNHVSVKEYVNYWAELVKYLNKKISENHMFELQPIKSTRYTSPIDLIMLMRQNIK